MLCLEDFVFSYEDLSKDIGEGVVKLSGTKTTTFFSTCSITE